jgi:hypothetical protein
VNSQALAAGNARVSRPGAAEHDVVLLVEEVGCLSRVERHRGETLPGAEDGTGPFPDASHVPLTGKGVTSSSDRRGVPVLESNIGSVQVDEELLLALSVDLGDGRRGRWRDLYSVV